MLTKEKYNQLVAEGRRIVESMENNKLQLVRIALKVCDQIHGGAQKNVYTIKDFATDIGFSERTLSNWVGDYKRLEKKIPKELINKTNESALFRAARKFNLSTPPKKALEIFNKEVAKSKEDIALVSYVHYSKSMDFFINHSVLLDQIDQDELRKLQSHINNVNNKLNVYFASKKPKTMLKKSTTLNIQK